MKLQREKEREKRGGLWWKRDGGRRTLGGHSGDHRFMRRKGPGFPGREISKCFANGGGEGRRGGGVK